MYIPTKPVTIVPTVAATITVGLLYEDILGQQPNRKNLDCCDITYYVLRQQTDLLEVDTEKALDFDNLASRLALAFGAWAAYSRVRIRKVGVVGSFKKRIESSEENSNFAPNIFINALPYPDTTLFAQPQEVPPIAIAHHYHGRSREKQGVLFTEEQGLSPVRNKYCQGDIESSGCPISIRSGGVH